MQLRRRDRTAGGLPSLRGLSDAVTALWAERPLPRLSSLYVMPNDASTVSAPDSRSGSPGLRWCAARAGRPRAGRLERIEVSEGVPYGCALGFKGSR